MSTRPSGNRTCLYNTAQLERVIDAMSKQAAGLLATSSRVMVVGILRRGAPLAAMLHQRLARLLPQVQLSVMNVQIKRYADDLTLLHPRTQLTEDPELAALDLSGVTVLVVDDVMYSGNSMLSALAYLAQKQAAEIRTAVLVDRGAARLPVRSDIVGVRLDVAPSDIIECNVPPYERELKIELLQPHRHKD